MIFLQHKQEWNQYYHAVKIVLKIKKKCDQIVSLLDGEKVRDEIYIKEI